MPSLAIIPWLLKGDPAIRWQVLQDLLHRPAAEVAEEQNRIAHEGWGARLLSHQGPQGCWSGLYTPEWTSATYTLLLLRQFGLAPGSPAAKHGATILLDAGFYRDNGINFWHP